MSDLAWCTHCDKAISQFSESLYCSEQCLRNDALKNHPLLGYTYPEFVDFPRPHGKPAATVPSQLSAVMPEPKPLAMSTSSSRSSICSAVPTLSTSHSTLPSPALSSSHASDDDIDRLHLPTSKKTPTHPAPSCLFLGRSTPTTALSRDPVFGL
ncbi:hypothetical protein BC940DRAFT_336629 [Gongronella butleri]|nr:hypothetical protein BC940DRAFT_336629 [Gongronella butleri]